MTSSELTSVRRWLTRVDVRCDELSGQSAVEIMTLLDDLGCESAASVRLTLVRWWRTGCRVSKAAAWLCGRANLARDTYADREARREAGQRMQRSLS